jgi:hypothetical protein
MSIISTSANYGGRINDNQQYIKQFFISSTNIATWIYKKLSNGLTIQTLADKTKPVLIDNDLIVTGSIFNSSDERLKKNITTITNNELDSLFVLNPVHYLYKHDKNEKLHYGLIAQDVEKVFPELVENNNISGYKTVNYQEFIPLMLAKMKSMQNEIDELKETKK